MDADFHYTYHGAVLLGWPHYPRRCRGSEGIATTQVMSSPEDVVIEGAEVRPLSHDLFQLLDSPPSRTAPLCCMAWKKHRPSSGIIFLFRDTPTLRTSTEMSRRVLSLYPLPFLSLKISRACCSFCSRLTPLTTRRSGGRGVAVIP